MASTPSEQRVYVVLVVGKLKAGQMPEFMKLFKPLADHVMQNEDGCLSYQFSICDTDPDRLMIFERYVSKQYLEDVHWKSEPFLTFRRQTAEAGIVWEMKEVTKYYEELPGALGFMERSK